MSIIDVGDEQDDSFSSVRAKIQAVLGVWPSQNLKYFAARLELQLTAPEVPHAEKDDFVQQICSELESFGSNRNVLSSVVASPKVSRLRSMFRKTFKPTQVDAEERLHNLIWSLSERANDWEKKWEGYIRHEALFTKVVSYLQDGEKDVIILSGMVGMGKTLLAHDIEDHFQRGSLFPGGVHFVPFSDKSCEGPESYSVQDKMKQGLQTLSHSMKLRVDDGADIWQAVSLAIRSQKCLLILDAIWDTEIITRFRFPYHKGKLLVTSRQQNLWCTAEVFLIHPLDIQAEKMDERLLVKLTSLNALSQDVKDRILMRCGGCPRLVFEMATVLQKKTDSWEQIAEKLLCEHLSFSGIFKEVDICLNALLPEARKIMDYLGLFKPGLPVPKAIIEKGWRSIPGLSDTAALPQIFIDSICDLNLVTRDREQGNVSCLSGNCPFTVPLVAWLSVSGQVSLARTPALPWKGPFTRMPQYQHFVFFL